MSQSSSSPPLVTTLRHAPVGALEALELVAAVDLDAVLLEHALEEAADLACRTGARASTSSSITIEHFTPVRRGQRRRHLAADVAAADQHDVLGLPRRRRGSRPSCRTRAGSGCPSSSHAVDAQPAHVRAGGQQRLVERAPRPCSTSVATRSPVSSFITLVRVISSMSCSSHHSSGRNSDVLARLLAAAGTPSTAAGGCRAGRARGPTSRTEPSAPSSRSQRAQLRGRQAAADQQVVDRAVGHGSGRGRSTRLGEALGDAAPRARCRAPAAPRRPASTTESAGGHEAAAVAQDRDHERAVRAGRAP